MAPQTPPERGAGEEVEEVAPVGVAANMAQAAKESAKELASGYVVRLGWGVQRHALMKGMERKGPIGCDWVNKVQPQHNAGPMWWCRDRRCKAGMSPCSMLMPRCATAPMQIPHMELTKAIIAQAQAKANKLQDAKAVATGVSGEARVGSMYGCCAWGLQVTGS